MEIRRLTGVDEAPLDASTAYEGIGFRRTGDYCLVLFR